MSTEQKRRQIMSRADLRERLADELAQLVQQARAAKSRHRQRIYGSMARGLQLALDAVDEWSNNTNDEDQ